MISEFHLPVPGAQRQLHNVCGLVHNANSGLFVQKGKKGAVKGTKIYSIFLCSVVSLLVTVSLFAF